MSDETLPAVVADAEAQIELARERPSRHGSVLPSPDEWAATMTVANTIARTEFVPKDYRGKPESVVAAILMGREIGIGPMESLRQITMIDGRPTLSAALMLSKMRENGLVILESKVDDDRAWIRAQRTDTGEIAEVEWTYADAEKITRGGKKLVDGDNWRNYRQDMLWARCVGRLARRLGSDLLGGNLYSTEEVRDFDDAPAATSYEQASDGTSAYFDPGAALLRDAIKGGDDVPGRIMQSLNVVDPSIDWPATIARAIEGCFGVESAREIPPERGQEFWIRLANAAAKAGEKQTGDFPPVEASVIEAAFAWAFSLEAFEVVVQATDAETVELDAQEETAVSDRISAEGAVDDTADIPFGEEGAASEGAADTTGA